MASLLNSSRSLLSLPIQRAVSLGNCVVSVCPMMPKEKRREGRSNNMEIIACNSTKTLELSLVAVPDGLIKLQWNSVTQLVTG